MTWIKTVPASEDERVKKASEAQRHLYPIEYASPVHPTVDGDTAHGSWDVVLPMTSPSGQPNLGFGAYDEVYERTAEGWKFRSLRFYLAGLTLPANGYDVPDDTGMR